MASELVVTGQQQGRVDPDLVPARVVEEIIGPIWFRVMVLQSTVDDEFIEALVERAIG